MGTRLTAQTMTLPSLLRSHRRFLVPPHQRVYGWGETQIDRLLTDFGVRVGARNQVSIARSALPWLFLGTIYLSHHETGAVVDIADGGVRATTSSRLLPGTHVDVHVVTRVGRVLQRARVARAAVTFVDAQRLVYEVALCFDAPIDSAPVRVVATPWRPDGPAPGYAIPGADDARPEPPVAATSPNPVDRNAGGTGIGKGPA